MSAHLTSEEIAQIRAKVESSSVSRVLARDTNSGGFHLETPPPDGALRGGVIACRLTQGNADALVALCNASGQLLDAAEERNQLFAKLEFLKEKGITAGVMRSSDRSEPYLAYDVRKDSELDDGAMLSRLVDAEAECQRMRDRLKRLDALEAAVDILLALWEHRTIPYKVENDAIRNIAAARAAKE